MKSKKPRVAERNGAPTGQFEGFLAELAGAVTERVKAVSTRKGGPVDPGFFDESKTVIEWPERSAYIMEELR